MLKVRGEDDVQRLASDLHEDLATRWIPDVLADVDLTARLHESSMRRDDVFSVEVPRVDGGLRVVPMFGGPALRALRDAVTDVREISEAALDPAVCGYRSGAAGDSRYSDEYRRFRDMAAAMADQHRYVVVADISNFFESVSMATVRDPMLARFGAAWESVENFLNHAQILGVRGLPAGYGDARLIANLILSRADEEIGAPFTRWVDDYRIFADSQQDVSKAITGLKTALVPLGLNLNHGKLRIMKSVEYLRRKHGVPLDSVYHPQDEAPEIVRTNLRSIFLRAVSEKNRRMLRFVLPRLAEQADDIAVSYVIAELRNNAVDAPRMVQYLSAFVGVKDVANQIDHLVVRAAEWPWVLLRLSPLLARISLTSETVRVLSEILRRTSSPAVWGLVLRILSIHQEASAVREALSQPGQVPDARAAVGACSDLDLPVTRSIRTRAPQTSRVVERLPFVPLPKTESLL